MTPNPQRLLVEIRNHSGIRAVEVTGRGAWALLRLIEAGARGCTPLICPAPRWSAYVHNLRALGFNIETLLEAHGGPYGGHHARYVLNGDIRIITPSDADVAV